MGQALSLNTVVVGGGTTAPPYLHTHTVRRRLQPAVVEWTPCDDRDWLKTPSPARADILVGGSSPPQALVSLMSMADRTQSASSLHRRVTMTRRFTQLQAQLSTGTPEATPRPAAALTTSSANSVATSTSLTQRTISSSGSDYSECIDDGRSHGSTVQIPPPLPPSAAVDRNLHLSPGGGPPQLPPTPGFTPGSKIPVLSPTVVSSARKVAQDNTPVKEFLAARGLEHYTEAFVSSRHSVLMRCTSLEFTSDQYE
eukprot:COSAG02_NODE_8210_length_2657_cov_3.524238_3_plen_255_part_00